MATNLPTEPDRPLPARDGHEPGGVAIAQREPFGPDAAEGGANLRMYLLAVLRYKWLVLAAVLLGGVAGMGLSRLAKPEYLAQARIWIQVSQEKQPIQGPIQPGHLLDSSGWTDLLRSYTVLDPVVLEQRLYLGLASPADSAALAGFALMDRFRPGEYRLTVQEDGRTLSLATGDGVVVQEAMAGDAVGTELGFRWVPPVAALRPGAEIAFTVRHPREAARALSGRIVTRLGRDANLLELELTGTRPARVAATLNAVADRFVRVAAELKRAKLNELVKILNEQLVTAEEKLRAAEIELESFKVATITLPTERATPIAVGLEETRDPVFDNFFQMKIEQEQLRRDRGAIEGALAQVRDSSFSVAALEYIGSVQGSAELSAALNELTNKEGELRAFRSRYTDEYLPVRQLIEQIRTLRRQTIPRLARILIQQMVNREMQIEARIRAASTELERIPPRQLEEARLARAVMLADKLYTDIRQRYETAKLAAASSIPDLTVLEEAVVPRRPFRDDRHRIILLGFLGGLALGIAGAILRDRLDPRVRYPEEVTQGLHLTILGAIPFAQARNGLLREDTTTQMIEAFRELRLSVMHAHGAAGPLVTTITSPGSGDGKSLITANLALAFADQGHRTLLIDGDIRRGAQHRLLSASRKPGLTDILMGKASIESAAQQTPYPALHVIAGGTRMQGGPELLGSAAMVELLRDLRSRYSVILVDSPPLGAGVDPYILGTLTGNLVFVLRTGYTDREFAEAKLEALDRLPVRILGAVLNAVPARGVYRYYTYLPGYESREEAEEEGVEVAAKQLPGV